MRAISHLFWWLNLRPLTFYRPGITTPANVLACADCGKHVNIKRPMIGRWHRCNWSLP